jgi:hypothetical protein
VETDVIDGWWFGTLAVVAIFATPTIAPLLGRKGARRAGPADVPLEWVGIDRPFSADDVRALDTVLALPEAAPR